jgi:uncharacterized protein YceH (UPF0502 family)
MEPDAVEIRVLGCLVEKQHTTPGAYPLSLNALRLACNQATNREPVVDYDEQTVVEALRRLALRGWTRLASGAGSRARKYRHLLEEAFGLDDAQASLLAVLMLRGPQTPGELKQRADRLHRFADLAAVHEALGRLVERGQVARHERRPGQKEDRYEQLLGGEAIQPTAANAVDGVAEGDKPLPGLSQAGDAGDELRPAEDRLTRLEREVAELRAEIAALRADLGD